MNTSQTSEHYHSYNHYLTELFGGKTYKVVVASGLTCPNRDGTVSKTACAFCDLRGSSSFHGKQGRGNSVSEQIQKNLPAIQKRFNATGFLAYFQSYTNTYAEVTYLREIYEAALTEPGIQGLCIGTRPDCLPDEVLDLLEEFAQRAYVSLELGVQSFENPALEWLTRGHDRDCSIQALTRLKQRAPHVHTCVHLILGSPPDSTHAARDAALLLNQLGARGAKLHQLMVLEHTELAERYRKEPFPTPGLDEYAEKVVEFIEHLNPSIYIERLYATASHPEECLAPEWSRTRWNPHNRLRDLLEQRRIRQGAKLA
ncbi:TIGR01212 family radical SAM protein [Bdellovibrionota bacterium FG-1]